MFLYGEINHFSFYFGKNQNVIYCRVKVYDCDEGDLVYQKPKFNPTDKIVAVKLVQKLQTVPLLLERQCYFELVSEPDKEKGNTYTVINLLTEEQYNERKLAKTQRVKRLKFTGKKFDFSLLSPNI